MDQDLKPDDPRDEPAAEEANKQANEETTQATEMKEESKEQQENGVKVNTDIEFAPVELLSVASPAPKDTTASVSSLSLPKVELIDSASQSKDSVMKNGIINQDGNLEGNIKQILDNNPSLTPMDKQILNTFVSQSNSKPRLDRQGNPILKVNRAEMYAELKR